MPRCRPSASLSDLQVLSDFVRAVRLPARVTEYPGLADLPELLSQARIRRQTALWFDADGRLAGYALVDSSQNLVFESRPELGDTLDMEFLAWGLSCAHRSGQAALDAFARASDTVRAARLAALGFTPLEDRTLYFARPLDRPIPVPELPPGFIIRPTYGDSEAAEWVRLHRAAFGTRQMTRAGRLALLRNPEHDLALDLVAVAPDGRLAAYCVGAISPSENEQTGILAGTTDPVATHPDFQRRGLSQALLRSALRLLRERGMQMARLGTSSANLAMQAAARRAGFELVDETRWYTRNCPELSGAGVD